MMTGGSIIVLLLFKTHLEVDMIKVKCFFYDVVKHDYGAQKYLHGLSI